MRTTRLSQTVSPFGVGAVLDILGESLMAADISRWPIERTHLITSRRLQERLGVAELRTPPSVPSYPSKNTPGLPYERFPSWLFCQDCRRMQRLRHHDETGEPPVCRQCTGPMVPMRFIVVGTERGHAMDVPWVRWAHSEPSNEDQRRCRVEDLLFLTRTGTSSEGLGSLVVRCVTCRAERDLSDLTARGSLSRINVRCNGAQPWQRTSVGSCNERLEVVQRGATNVTLSETTTALDIPEPEVPVRDDEAEIRQHKNFEDVQSAPTGPFAPTLIQMIANDVGVSTELVQRVVSSSAADPDQEMKAAREGLLTDEWQAFRQAIENPGEVLGTPTFRVSATPFLGPDAPDAFTALDATVGPVVLAHRLREIRVLHGFRRYDLDADLVDADLGPRGRARWLPAVESFGEGVLLTLDEAKLADWERRDPVIERARGLERRRRDSPIGSRFTEATPRLILLHTLAHILMRQLAFSCGYSAASLRERVYAATGGASPESGVLIYTAAGDAEGTLGGLVRQGEAPRLARTLVSALEAAAWCSSDPLCRSSRGQGMGSMNLAACHGCCLVSETSCERGNLLLDRILLIGDVHTPGYGFFEEAIASAQLTAASHVTD
ncbi:DrmB family protein [Actinoplanes sp. NPDC049265]|uniref:DrmB family protein n=1 Tax=Actinoplanes sp. NPDC049265 TaxID=3363902 RepID=UPI003716A68D